MEHDLGINTTMDQGQGQQLGIRPPAAKPLERQHSVPRHHDQQRQQCRLQHTDQRVTAEPGCSVVSPCKRARTLISPFMEIAVAHHIRDPAASVDGSSAATVLGWAAAGQGGATGCKWSAANGSMEECRSLGAELCHSSITSQRQVSSLQQQQQPQQQPQHPEGLVFGSPLARIPAAAAAAAAAAVPRVMARSCTDTPPMGISYGSSSAQYPVLDLQQQQHQQQRQTTYAAAPEAVDPPTTSCAAAAPSASLRHRYLSPLAALPTHQLHQLLLNIDGQVRQRQEVSYRPEAGPADGPEAQRKLRTLIKLRTQVSRQLLARHKQADTMQSPAAAAAATASGATAEAAKMAQDGCAVQRIASAAGHEQTQQQTEAEQQQQYGHQHAEQQQHKQQQSRLLQQLMQLKDNLQPRMRQAVLGQEQQHFPLQPPYHHHRQQQDYLYEASPPCNTVKQQQQNAGALLHPAATAALPVWAAAAIRRNSSSITPPMSTTLPAPAPAQACSARSAATAAAGCDPAVAAAAVSDNTGSTHEATRLCQRKHSDSLAIWGCYQGLSATDIPPGWHSNVLQGLEEAVPQGLLCPMELAQTVSPGSLVDGSTQLEPVVQLDPVQFQIQILQNASSRFSCNASSGSKSPAPAAGAAAGTPSQPTLAAAAALTPNNATANSAAAAAAAARTAILAAAPALSSGTTALHSKTQQPPDLLSAVSGGDAFGPDPATAAAAVEAEAALPIQYDSDPFTSVDDFLDGLRSLEALAATPPPQDPQTCMPWKNPAALGWQQQHQQYRPSSSSDGLIVLDHMWSEHRYAPVLSDLGGAAAAVPTPPAPPPPPVPPPAPAGAAAAMTGRASLPHGAMAFNREQQQLEAQFQSRSPFALTHLRQQQQQQQQFAEGRLLFDQQQHQQKKLQTAHPRRVISQQGISDQSMGGLLSNLHPAGASTGTAAATVLEPRTVLETQYMLETASTQSAPTPHQHQQQQHYIADQWAHPLVRRNPPQLHGWAHQSAAREQLTHIWKQAQALEQQTHMMQPCCSRSLSMDLNQLDPASSAAAADYPMGYRTQEAGSGSNDQQQRRLGIKERLRQWQEQQQQWQQFFRKSRLPPVGSAKYKRLQQVWAVIKARDLVKQLPQEAVAMMAQLENSSTAAAPAGMGCQQQQGDDLAADVSHAPSNEGLRPLQQQAEWGPQSGSGCQICPQAAAAAAAGAAVPPGTEFAEVLKTASGELTVALGLLRAHSDTYSQGTAVAAAAEAAHLQASPLQISRCQNSSQQPRPLAPPSAAAAAMQMYQSNIHMMSPGSGWWLQPAVSELAIARVLPPTPAPAVVGPPQTSLAERADTHKPQQPSPPHNSSYLPAVARSPSPSSALAPPAAAAGPVEAHSPVAASVGGPVSPQGPVAAAAGDITALDVTCEDPFMQAFGTADALNPDLTTLGDEDTSWLEDLDADLVGSQHSLAILPLTASTEIEMSRLM